MMLEVCESIGVNILFLEYLEHARFLTTGARSNVIRSQIGDMDSRRIALSEEKGDFHIISNSRFTSGIGMVENAMHEQAAANSSLDSIEDQVGAASGADDSLGGVDQVENGRAFNPFAAYLPGGAEAEFERGVVAAAVGDSLGEIGQVRDLEVTDQLVKEAQEEVDRSLAKSYSRSMIPIRTESGTSKPGSDHSTTTREAGEAAGVTAQSPESETALSPANNPSTNQRGRSPRSHQTWLCS
eukprot:gene10276-8197_t